MKKLFKLFTISLVMLLVFTSCERVAPNYYGVLMQDYGKNGKSNFTLVKGRVNVMSPGSELFQVPAWEQRSSFTNDEGEQQTLNIKAADNTAFTAWYFGHFHEDTKVEDVFYCLYDDIVVI